MPDNRVAEADAIAAAYWSAVARLGEKGEVSDSIATGQAEAETHRTLAVEQTREAERVGLPEDD